MYVLFEDEAAERRDAEEYAQASTLQGDRNLDEPPEMCDTCDPGTPSCTRKECPGCKERERLLREGKTALCQRGEPALDTTALTHRPPVPDDKERTKAPEGTAMNQPLNPTNMWHKRGTNVERQAPRTAHKKRDTVNKVQWQLESKYSQKQNWAFSGRRSMHEL